MIYPTQRAVVLAALGAPAGLVIGVASPGGWAVALLWVLLIVALTVVDAVMARPIAGTLAVDMPGVVGVGDRFDVRPSLVGGDAQRSAFAVDLGPPAEPADRTTYRAARRGTARLNAAWVRRAGPWGLAWRQKRARGEGSVAILPNLRAVREQGMKQFLRAQQHGLRMRPEAGDGNEFQALTEFQPGMARRAIDWKASAKHLSLLAREYRTERANNLVFAIDAGRAMSDPVGDVPRIDRAMSAALLSAFVALRSGDHVRLFGFAGRPSVDSGNLAGMRAFAQLHRAAAEIDYAAEEANYTLSLVTLDQRLQRRSIVLLFTEFTDPTSAELMIAAARRMVRRHRVVFVLFADTELDDIATAYPQAADDITRANVAATLLRERRIVIERLKRLGIDVVEAAPDAMPLALVERYLTLRERA